MYEDLGRKAARAMQHRDGGLVQHLGHTFRRMIGVETAADKVAAREAYEAAYRAEAPVRNIAR